MRKNIVNFIATIIIAVILSQFLPWWSVMLASFITGLFLSLKRVAVLFVPFLAIAVFWMVYSFWLSNGNDFILAKKIAVLLPLKGNPYFLILITGIIGGLAAGVSGIFGKQCSLLLNKSN
ncbi:hypothetical protein L3X39_03350 [Sabulilitoribacter multivorans]|uniref:Uncharacterized protein n=1 Tax=Flaviramulus multivorans TaxID=1304750 RepID=A0ABS9IHP9_9FLAO|nr:hypothetical protein [Flaviramulus multivorans]MCF7559660.1 hypothetical protein [Flaviramulus multivorans]